jgi:hypothetical protein
MRGLGVEFGVNGELSLSTALDIEHSDVRQQQRFERPPVRVLHYQIDLGGPVNVSATGGKD